MAMALFPFYNRPTKTRVRRLQNVQLLQGMVAKRDTYAGLGLEDRVDTHDSRSRSWDDPVGQFSVSAEQNMTGQLSNGNIIGRLLELQNLLVHAH